MSSEEKFELRRIAPKSHWFVCGIPVVSRIELDLPAVFLNPSFDHAAHRNWLSGAHVHNAEIARRQSETDEDLGRTRYRQIITQLITRGHVKRFLAASDRYP